MVTFPAKARQLVASLPASYVAFDLLAVGGVDLRTQQWSARWKRLESVAAWEAPLQLSLVTDDPVEAAEWFDALAAIGVEGLVAKGKASRYEPGRRGWLKVNSVGLRGVRFSFDAWMCVVSVCVELVRGARQVSRMAVRLFR